MRRAVIVDDQLPLMPSTHFSTGAESLLQVSSCGLLFKLSVPNARHVTSMGSTRSSNAAATLLAGKVRSVQM
jgi:hypothetical protein